MRIIVCGINYAPEMIGIGPCNTALCEWLTRSGHEVEMVTAFPYYPSWKKRDEDRNSFARTEVINGVKVHRCWHYVPEKPTALKRILHEASFVTTAFFKQLTLKRADAYVVVSPPLALGVSAWVVSLLKRSPYVFHVQDLQPDAAVAMGMLKPGLLTKVLYAVESFSYRMASRVSGISDAMSDVYASKGVSREKIVCFPNSTKIASLESMPARGAFRRRMGFSDDDFIALYSGNLGEKQGLDILDGAARMLSNPRVKLVICGDGAKRVQLENEVKQHGLSNLHLLPLQPRKEYEEMMTDADCCLITQQPGSGACFFPSKLLTTLAFGKAVVAVADDGSVLSKAVTNGKFGVLLPPLDSKGLVAALEKLALEPGQISQMGKSGREYVEQFDPEQVMPKFEAVLQDMAASPNS